MLWFLIPVGAALIAAEKREEKKKKKKKKEKAEKLTVSTSPAPQELTTGQEFKGLLKGIFRDAKPGSPTHEFGQSLLRLSEAWSRLMEF